MYNVVLRRGFPLVSCIQHGWPSQLVYTRIVWALSTWWKGPGIQVPVHLILCRSIECQWSCLACTLVWPTCMHVFQVSLAYRSMPMIQALYTSCHLSSHCELWILSVTVCNYRVAYKSCCGLIQMHYFIIRPWGAGCPWWWTGGQHLHVYPKAHATNIE